MRIQRLNISSFDNTSTIDKHINTSPLLNDCQFSVIKLLVVSQITFDHQYLSWELLSNLAHLFHVCANHGHLRSIIKVPKRETSADTTRCSSNNAYFVQEESIQTQKWNEITFINLDTYPGLSRTSSCLLYPRNCWVPGDLLNLFAADRFYLMAALFGVVFPMLWL